MSSLHEMFLEYEHECKYNPSAPSEQIQQLLSVIKTMNAYEVVILEDTSEYIRYEGIKSSFPFIESRGKLYYHPDTKQVALITSYDSDSSKKKVYVFEHMNDADIKQFHKHLKRQTEVHTNPFVMRVSAEAHILMYLFPVMAVISLIVMLMRGLSIQIILLALLVYGMLYSYIIFLRKRYPM